jgi:hypothetical protein
MSRRRIVLAFTVCAAVLASRAKAAAAPKLVSAARVDEIAAMLDDKPFVPGPPIGDRAAWAALATAKPFAHAVADAQAALARPMPEMTAEVYGEYLKTGTRTKHYADVRADRHNRIATYALAECIEDKGRFIGPLQDVIRRVCDEPTWTFNFHDPKLDYWNRRAVFVDLGAFMPAQDMTAAAALLGDRLDAPTRTLIHDECLRRIIEPYRASLTGTGPTLWWMDNDANWNAVCTYGVVGVALGTAIDRRERALVLAGAQLHMRTYIGGFGGDGYCGEGMGYWNYGFSHYLWLAELASRATRGKLDLFDIPGAKLAAMYPARMEIVNGVTPAYADGGGGGAPDKVTFTLATRRYQTGVQSWQLPTLVSHQPLLEATLLLSSLDSAPAVPAKSPAPCYPPAPLRDYFQHSGILTCRPAAGGDFGVSLKGGNNDEPHNHNDLGTFVVVHGDQPLILDPGGSPYTIQTFSKDRYLNPMLSSFGHPVPRLAGALQRPGKSAVAKVTRAEFTDATDVYEMDLTSAYAVPSLTSFRRTFRFDRGGGGSLRVTDAVAFKSPQAYESALITYGSWRQEPDGSLLIWQSGQAVRVAVDAGGATWRASGEQFGPNAKRPTRIAIALDQPVATATVTLNVTPAPAPK